MGVTTTPESPKALPVAIENLPRELTTYPQWVGWAYEFREDKWTKPPRSPRNGELASTTDATTWGTYADAIERWRRGRGNGVGFVFSASDPFFMIDLDKCMDDAGNVAPWAAGIVARMPIYWEVSPSGRGLRGIGHGALPAGRRRTGTIEMYDDGRFATLTGHFLEGHSEVGEDASVQLAALHAEIFHQSEPAKERPAATTQPAEDVEIIERCRNFRNGATFEALMRGDTSEYGGDDSAADAALIERLLFANGGDVSQAVRIASDSALRREKWESRRGSESYIEYTARNILARMTEFYVPHPKPAESWRQNGHGPASAMQPSSEWRFDVVSLADVQPKPVDWIWPNWLAAGKLHILAGHPGDGKSTITAWLAAILSTGGTLPDGARIEQAGSLFLLGEDAVDDTLRPRLDQHGANVSRIEAIRAVTDGKRRGVVNLASHLDLLRDQLKMGRYRLLVVDPLTAFMPRTDRNAEGDVRDVLTPLADLADETGLALLAVAHVGKGSKDAGRRVLQMILGATAFGAAARVVWINSEIPDSEGRRLLQVVKSNIGPKPKGLEWSREIDGPVVWHGESDHDIEDVMQGGGPKALTIAADFLSRTLADGPVSQAMIELMSSRDGIAPRTLRRAKAGMGVLSERQGQGRNAPWYWRLPEQIARLDGHLNDTEIWPPNRTPVVGQSAQAGHLIQDTSELRLGGQDSSTEKWPPNQETLDSQSNESGHLVEGAPTRIQERLERLTAEPLPSGTAGGEPGVDRWTQ